MKKVFRWNLALWSLIALAAGMTACDDSSDGKDTTPGADPQSIAPVIIQSEEVMDNPLMLTFS